MLGDVTNLKAMLKIEDLKADPLNWRLNDREERTQDSR